MSSTCTMAVSVGMRRMRVPRSVSRVWGEVSYGSADLAGRHVEERSYGARPIGCRQRCSQDGRTFGCFTVSRKVAGGPTSIFKGFRLAGGSPWCVEQRVSGAVLVSLEKCASTIWSMWLPGRPGCFSAMTLLGGLEPMFLPSIGFRHLGHERDARCTAQKRPAACQKVSVLTIASSGRLSVLAARDGSSAFKC